MKLNTFEAYLQEEVDAIEDQVFISSKAKRKKRSGSEPRPSLPKMLRLF
ncbi:MAG: hypothetical protein HQM12_15840 [SAR324 cluster bacterium]|nr:hypothetical protein [SAR324 cluster bacterium]